MKITYSPAKHRANRQKHGIDFADVEGVFYDTAALTREDADHGEPRFVTLALDGFGRLLVVVYTYREPDWVRIISARKASPSERRCYWGEER